MVLWAWGLTSFTIVRTFSAEELVASIDMDWLHNLALTPLTTSCLICDLASASFKCRISAADHPRDT